MRVTWRADKYKMSSNNWGPWVNDDGVTTEFALYDVWLSSQCMTKMKMRRKIRHQSLPLAPWTIPLIILVQLWNNEKSKVELSDVADKALNAAVDTTVKFFRPSNNFDILSRVVLLASVADIILKSLGVSCCYFLLALVSLYLETCAEDKTGPALPSAPAKEKRSKNPVHWIFFVAVVAVFSINYFIQFSQN